MMNNFPATKTVHWVTGPVHACDLHTSQLAGLARFMGVHVGITPAPDGAQCSNCENANKLATQSTEGKTS